MSFGRAAACVGAGHLVLLCAAALLGVSPWRVPVPEVALLVAVYCSLYGRGGLVAQTLIGMSAGYLADLASGAPTGLHTFSVGAVGLLVRFAAPRLLIASVWQLFVIVYLAAFLHGIVVVGMSAAQASEGLAILVLVPEHALLTSLGTPLLFALFRRIDRQPPPRLQSAW